MAPDLECHETPGLISVDSNRVGAQYLFIDYTS